MQNKNAWFKRILADLTLDKQIVQGVVQKHADRHLGDEKKQPRQGAGVLALPDARGARPADPGYWLARCWAP